MSETVIALSVVLLFGKALLCSISIVKIDCVQDSVCTSHVQRELSVFKATLFM